MSYGVDLVEQYTVKAGTCDVGLGQYTVKVVTCGVGFRTVYCKGCNLDRL